MVRRKQLLTQWIIFYPDNEKTGGKVSRSGRSKSKWSGKAPSCLLSAPAGAAILIYLYDKLCIKRYRMCEY